MAYFEIDVLLFKFGGTRTEILDPNTPGLLDVPILDPHFVALWKSDTAEK